MIGILTAMREELQALLDQLDNKRSYVLGKRRYYQGELYGEQVVLVFSRWGKVAAATTATQLINDFEIGEMIFSGVAGSVKEDLHIGDIVIGTQLYQHDVNAAPLYPQFELPLLDKSYFQTDPDRMKKLVRASENFLTSFYQVISKKEATKYGISNPKVRCGAIASGDQFINERSQLNFINSTLPSVVCVEMEGAAVAQVCYEYEIPYSVIRIISDRADDNADVDFMHFSREIAGNYALHILKNYFENALY